MITSNIQLGFLLKRVGCKLSRAVYLAPHLEFQREWIICKFYYTIYYRNICWKRYKHYFSQSEMLTSNVQLGYILTRGGGQAVQGGLSCPPPRISKRMDNQQFLLHHLLQKYLVERDINFISVNLKCLLQTFSWVTYWQGVGGKLSRAVYLAPPPPEFQWESIIRKFYYTIYYRNISLREIKTLFQSIWNACFKRSVGLRTDKGWGASCPGRFILPPAQNFKENG